MSISVDSEGRSRQEQILLMAAEGLTDKEIANRLGLSPETVGTYWRRILAKYSACSRTEVVAKVIRLQAQASLSQAEDLNLSLQEVTDHLLLELSRHGENQENSPHMRLLQALPDLVLQVDPEGFVAYGNAEAHGVEVAVGEPLEWAVDRDDVDAMRECLSAAFESGDVSSCSLGVRGRRYDARIRRAPEGDYVAMVLRPAES